MSSHHDPSLFRIRSANAVIPLLIGVFFASAARAAPSIALACPANSGTAGVAYSSSLAVTGGVPPYKVFLTAGSLPPGLTLDGSTGALTGTPSSAGAFPFTAIVVDSPSMAGGSLDSTTVSCSITIASAPPPEPWSQVFDQSAVSFGQLTPMEPGSFVSDWESGIALVDFARLRQDGVTSGYIQVLEFDPGRPDEDGAWIVQNLPVGPPNAPGIGAPFVFAVPPRGPMGGMPVQVFQTLRPVAPVVPNRPNPPFHPPNMPNPPRPIIVPLHPVPTTIGGLFIPPPADPPTYNQIMPVDPKMERTDSQESLTETNSIEQRRNECAPASVANSLNYLARSNQVDDGYKKGAEGSREDMTAQQNRVNQLDSLMGYNANAGTSTSGILNGKRRYINGANPTRRPLPITMNAQGRFCPGASTDPNCPGGENGDSGATPTVDFITTALRDKKDVEMCFAWPARPAMAGPPPTPPSPGGAHCVFVTGYRFVNGYLVLDFTHDLNQANRGGVSWEDGGHMSARVGMVGNQLWLRNFFDRPARLTHVITEGPRP